MSKHHLLTKKTETLQPLVAAYLMFTTSAYNLKMRSAAYEILIDTFKYQLESVLSLIPILIHDFQLVG